MKNEEGKCKEHKGPIEQNENDVLCGRGSGVNSSPGNVYFRELVRARKERYKRAKRHLKIPITKEIIELIKNLDPPGRFLVRDENNEWKEYTNEQALTKTAQALREGATKAERHKLLIGTNHEHQNKNQILVKQSQTISPVHYNQVHRLQYSATIPSSVSTVNHSNLGNINTTLGILNNLGSNSSGSNSSLGTGYSLPRPHTPSESFAIVESETIRSNTNYPQSSLHSNTLENFNLHPNTNDTHTFPNPSNSLFQATQLGFSLNSRIAPGSGENERFDDAEENIETSLKTLMDSVQMKRRMQ